MEEGTKEDDYTKFPFKWRIPGAHCRASSEESVSFPCIQGEATVRQCDKHLKQYVTEVLIVMLKN